MPPKASRTGPSNRPSARTEDQKEEPLRAIVVADTFESKFKPLTLEVPRCLLPLVNVPLIEYTFEFLASAEVVEVFCYAGNFVDTVEEYIKSSRWHKPGSPFKKVTFLRCQATSVGDVMRDLDQKGLLGASGDFLVVSGDVVSDISIRPALKMHKQRREKDKNAIMTMILKERGVRNFASDREPVATFVIDPTRDRCLHYEETKAGADWAVSVDPEILKTSEIDVRQDLIDCRIDICTPDVLSLWSDNFDNQTLRKDFLFGVLKDYELNGKTIHTYIAQGAYVNRVADLKSYVEVTADLQKSLARSLALENNIHHTHFIRGQSGALIERDTIIARPSWLSPNIIIGEGSSIGAGTQIESSVLGKRCQIGKNCKIESSFIWDDTTIGDNVHITRAIIAREAFVGNDCLVEEGALISFGVKLPAGTRIPGGARITRSKQIPEDADPISKDSVRQAWQQDEDEEQHGELGNFGAVYAVHLFNDSTSSFGSDAEQPSSQGGSRSQSFATTMSEDDQTDRFQHDTVTILVQRMQENKLADDMLSELMGLRFSGSADEVQVRKAVATALMKHIHGTSTPGGITAAEATRKTLERYHTLIRRAQAEQSVEEQVLFLLDVQKDLTHRTEGGRILLFVTKDLYDLEVFPEESFIQWWDDSRSKATPELDEVRQPSRQFIEWLQNAESESEESDDSDEDD